MLHASCSTLLAARCTLQDALYLMLNQSQPHRFCLGAAASVYKFRKMLFAMTMARTLCCAVLCRPFLCAERLQA